MRLWKKSVLAAAMMCAWGGITQAQQMSPVPEAYQHCTVCHGTQLMGNESNSAPRLSHLQDWYLTNQLKSFRQGWRGSHPEDTKGNEMQAAAKDLPADSLQQTVDFIVSTVSPVPHPTLQGDVAAGKQLFASCQACHGADGKGNAVLKAPALAGQADWYIAQQLSNFLANKRGYSSEDSNGVMMKAASHVLRDENDVINVASYVATLAKPTKVARLASTSAVAESTQNSDQTSTTQTNTSTETGDPMNKKALAAAALATTLSVGAAAEPKRYPLPNNSTFPIARAVEVPAGTTLVYHSGQVPAAADTSAEKGSRKYYGDTYTQAMSVFKKFEASLTDIGLDFGDAVKLTVFLVGDPEMDGKMDFGGFMKAYTQFFGTEEQPNLPARSAIQIAGLAGGPGMLVEIEMVLAKPDK